MSVRLILDSTTDAPDSLQGKVEIVPLVITFGDKEYIDGIDIGHEKFYELLIESDVLPTTSQPAPASFAQAYERVIADGDEAVVITISSKLSGTYQSACIAASEYPGKVFVVDSLNAAIGAGILAEYAMSLVEQGMGAKEIAETLTRERDKVSVIALMDTLEYLKRSGRISKVAAVAGGLLSIKPVITLRDGAIEVLGKARGSKQGNNLMIKEIRAAGGVDFDRPVLLGYTGLDNSLLLKYMEDSSDLWKPSRDHLEYRCVTGAIGTHTGPGAVAVAFFKKH